MRHSVCFYDMNKISLQEIMSPSVVTVSAQTPVDRVLAVMEQNRISCVVASDDGGYPQGIFTEQDAIRLMAERRVPADLVMQDVMSAPPTTARGDMDFREGYQKISEKGCRHIVLVDVSGRLIGVASETDFMHHMGMDSLVELRTVQNSMNREVRTLNPAATLEDAARLMSEHRISCVLIEEAGAAVGIITERDIVGLARTVEDPAQIRVSRVMKHPVQTIQAHCPLEAAMKQMAQFGVRRLVVTERGKISGLITRHDIVKAMQGQYIEFLHETLERQRLDLEKTQQQVLLAQQQLLAHSLLEQVQDSIVVFETSGGRIVEVNDQCCRDLGYMREELLELAVSDIAPGIGAASSWTDENGRLAKDEQRLFEAQYRRRDGSTYPVEISARRVAQSGVDYIVAIARDLTERKNSERKLQASEQTYRGMINSVDDAIYVHDESGKILDVNAAAETMYGYRREDFLGKTKEFLLAPEISDAGCLTAATAQALAGNPQHLRFWGRRKNGELFLKEVTLSRGEYFGRSAVIAIARDISARERIERSLRESEMRYREMMDNVREIFFQTDAAGCWTFLNPAWQELTGFQVGESLGRPLADYLHADDRQRNAALFESLMRGDQESFRCEMRYVSRDGGIKWVEAYARLGVNGSGEMVGIYGTLMDVTQRKSAEEALQQQLLFTNALNSISKTVVEHDDAVLILRETVRDVCEALGCDRALIYDVSFSRQEACGLAEWINPAHPDISPTLATYPLTLFIGGANEIRQNRNWLVSQCDAVHPAFLEDGSGELLHGTMMIRSLLWYPFAFRDDGYYLLTLNHIHSARVWSQKELEFLGSVSQLVSIEFEKIRLMEESRRSEEASRAASLYSRSLIEASLDPLVTISAEGKITDVNTGTEKATGVDRGRMIGSDFADYFTDPQKARQGYREVFEQGYVTDYPLAIRHVSGRITDVLYNASLYRDEKGNIAGVFASARDITERKRLDAEREKLLSLVSENEERWKFALEGSGDGVWDWNPQTDQALFSPVWKGMLGYQQGEFVDTGAAWLAALHPDDKGIVTSVIADYFAGRRSSYIAEFRMKCKDGSWKWIMARGILVSRDVEGRPLRMIGTHTDISDRKEVEQQIRIAATAFESQEGMAVTDADGTILRVNSAFCNITGYSAEEAIGKNPRFLKSGRQDGSFYRQMWAEVSRKGAWEGEIWNRRKSGEIYPEHLTITAVKGEDNRIANYVATLTDITLTKAAEDEIRHLAFYDPLTGLPNRRLLFDRLRQALAARLRSGHSGALLFIDLDNFKSLNDTQGHDVGDLLLQQVAQRLTGCVREGDTVARLGGDEFVVMLENLSRDGGEAATQTEAVGNQILAALNQPYQLGGHECINTPSIGAIVIGDDNQTVDELIKQADIAMYQSKKAGRNALRFFDPKTQQAVYQRAMLEDELRRALHRGQFELYYQIQVDGDGVTGNHRPAGAEALIRWMHPERGMVSPAEFIPLAEETGLILPIGQWVLEEACTRLALWADRPELEHLTLAVNVSGHQFHQENFVDWVLGVLEKTGANPARLKLELTESMLLNDIEGVIAKMGVLKAHGVGFSLDDFGTGYSSLSYLSRLPLDQLKIDRSFVVNLESSDNSVAICAATTSLAHSLKLKVVAEGIETETQSYIMSSGHRCDYLQGYLFGKPVSVDVFESAFVSDKT